MSNFFINRPIVAMVIAILMVICGLVAMIGLPTAQFPNIAPPEIQVKATYTGADAETIEQSVATPIEQQMSGVDNMQYMYSTNSNSGYMTLTVNFDVKTDPSTDQILSQMRTNQANSQLPSDVINAGVTVQKSTMAPLMLITLSSPKGSYQVAVVGGDKKVSIRPVKIGDRVGSMWIITEGVKPGEQVIAEGTQKAKAGTVVNPKPFRSAAGSM